MKDNNVEQQIDRALNLPKYKVDRGVFIDWIMDECMIYSYNDVREMLKLTGKFSLTAEQVFRGFSTIPTGILENYKGDKLAVRTIDCILVTKKYFKDDNRR